MPVKFLASALLICLASTVQAQQLTVQGKVVERGTGDPIPAATVQISGMRETLTGPAGTFVIPGVKPGQRTLQITMIGYQSQSLQINVQRDTTIVIELEVEAVKLKDVTVQNERYSVRGTVKEREHGRPVMDADIFSSVRGTAARTNSAGRFRVSRLPVGSVSVIQVVALGLKPVTIHLDAIRDTTIDFLLEPDPVGVRMLQGQIDKLDIRVKSLPYKSEAFSREYLMERYYNYEVHDLLGQLLGLRGGMQCLLIDDRLSTFGLIELQGMLPDQIERIELIDRGTMVRVYTRRFVQKLATNTQPGPIMLMKALGFGKTICK